MKSKNTLLIISLIVLLVVLIGVGPILTIMSMNTLFNTGIALNFYSWISVVWLSLVAGGICGSKFKS